MTWWGVVKRGDEIDVAGATIPMGLAAAVEGLSRVEEALNEAEAEAEDDSVALMTLASTLGTGGTTAWAVFEAEEVVGESAPMTLGKAGTTAWVAWEVDGANVVVLR